MFSRRTGQNLVRLFLKFVKIDHRWLCLIACGLAITIFGIGKITAQKSAGKSQEATKNRVNTMAGAFRASLAKTFRRDISATPVTTVSAASFENSPVAPESIAAAFGVQLATQTTLATDADPNTPGIQLPTQLGGTTVEVNGRRAGLFFVSSGQVNYLMPAQTESGTANVVIRSGDGTISNGTVMIARVAPAVFSANSNGDGVAAATILRIKGDGSQIFEPMSQFNQQVGRYVTKPIDLGPESDLVFLVLYLTGIRQADNPDGNQSVQESIQVLIGGVDGQLVYAGRQPDFVGLDQVNVLVPRSLIGRGVVNVTVSGIGFTTSNLVNIELAGGPGSSPPQVSGFGGSALAGNTIVINGTGFSPTPLDNVVKIAGLDATVMAASATQLTVMVPFGVESGTVSVRTFQGEGVSAEVLPVRTSISGVVENTLRQPMANVTVRVDPDLTVNPITTTTDSDGIFVLPDISPGLKGVEIDGSEIPTNPPYPKITLKITALSNRDNRIATPISLQQATGSSGTIGSGSSSAVSGSGGLSLAASPASFTIQTGEFKLDIPDGLKALFPDNRTRGEIFLTPLQDARTPVELPYSYYSASIVQITPFGVKLDPGVKLTLPNTEGYPAGSSLTLFRYNPESGRFVWEPSKATVSMDGQRIETEPDAIKVTSIYFAAEAQQTTTIAGRVFDSDGKTPLPRVLTRIRGQEATTDGNGSYVLRYVPIRNSNDGVTVEASYARNKKRVIRVLSDTVLPVLGGITKMPDIILPKDLDNRPPNILIPKKTHVVEGERKDITFVVNDPDSSQIAEVIILPGGPRFASLPLDLRNATKATYTLRLEPGYNDAGEHPIKLRATDDGGASVEEDLVVVVRDVNRAPVAKDQSIDLEEDSTAAINLEATDADNDRVTYSIVGRPVNGSLSGTLPNLTYRPALNFNGTDQFTFKANDGSNDSVIAKVTITVKPVNDPPVLSVPASQTINEGQQLSFAVTASDPDAAQTLTISSVNALPNGASLTTSTPTSAQFSWTPTFSQSGSYTLTFKVTDNGNPQLSDTKEAKVLVNDVRLLLTPESLKVNEGQSLLFNVSVLGAGANQPVTISAIGVPEGAVLSNPSAGGRQFRWTPSFFQAGSYVVTFKAMSEGDSPINETKDVLITVLDVQRDLTKEPSPLTVFGGAGQAPAPETDGGDQLGLSVVVGDLNSDRISDLVVGAPMANGKGVNSGQVYIFFGKADPTNPESSIDLARQSADITLTGEASEDHLGASLAVGDFNGDGKTDLMIGAPSADAVERPDAGKVYVVYGDLTAGSFEIVKEADVTLNGAQRSDHFGSSLAAGFVHSKGAAADLIVGAPGYDLPAQTASVVDAGAVYTFFGDSSLPASIDLADTAAGYTITGVSSNAHIGTTLAAGNFNGDDFVDFAIGSPFASMGAKANGVVYLVAGAATLAGSRNVVQASAFLMIGTDDADHLGASLAMGDLNADGRADLVMGAPGGDGQDNTRQNVGEAYVIYGSELLQGRPADLTIFGAGAASDAFGDALGTSLAIGDFTGDGILDLVMGAPGADGADAKRNPTGAAYLLFGARVGLTGILDFSVRAADLTIYGADPGDNLGSGGIGIGNLNSADANDLILGIPLAGSVNNSRLEAGEVRVLWGVKR